MPRAMDNTRVVVVGAGPVGSLAALYASGRGYQVHVYELRGDLRDPSTTPLNFTKSINLALSERGINALRSCGDSRLLKRVLSSAIPMHGRMVHTRTSNGTLREDSQRYDAHGKPIYAVDRADLNGCLLDALEARPNVAFHFNHKLVSANFRNRKATFEIVGAENGPGTLVNVEFDFMIGADGAHSAVRSHLMKVVHMDYHQVYMDTWWCEFTIKAKESRKGDPQRQYKLDPHHLHIWPGKEFMFIALPSCGATFTCTLFLRPRLFADLDDNPESVPAFFDHHFPGVTDLISPDDLVESFMQNPHLPLISVKCRPYHYSSSVVLIGDAAHAMVPFYGQGMNAGFEDVRILFDLLQLEWEKNFDADKGQRDANRADTLKIYSMTRPHDAHAINDLALENYEEMRSTVLNPAYKFRKAIEEWLSVNMPWLGWETKYQGVSFGNNPYSEVVRKSERQGRVLTWVFTTVVSSPVVIAGAMLYRKYSHS